MDPVIRDATPADLEAINEIYNHYVLHSTGTFDTQPVTPEQRLAWWREREGRLPVVVRTAGERVIGWAALSTYEGRCAYSNTVEDSVYVDAEQHGRGHGRALLAALLERGKAGGFRSVIAKVVADQEPSLRLHADLGFAEVGRLVEVGYKFERWLDVVIMQRRL